MKFPKFIKGLDPHWHINNERLFDRVQFELDLWDEGEPECDIKSEAQANKARKYLEYLKTTINLKD